MITNVTFHIVIMLIINAISLWTGLTVGLLSEKKPQKIAFLIMTLFMMIWINFAFIPRLITPGPISHLMLKIAWIVTPPFFFMTYYFTKELLSVKERYDKLSKTIIVISILLSIITAVTDGVISGEALVKGNLIIHYGNLLLPFLTGIAIIISAVIYILIKEKFYKDKSRFIELKPYLIGLLIFYVANIIFNLILPMVMKISYLYFFGDYSTVILAALIAYSLLRHRFLGVRIILSILLISTVLILLVANLVINLLLPGSGIVQSITSIVTIFTALLLIRSVVVEAKQKELLKKISMEQEQLIKKMKEQEKQMVFLTEMNEIKSSFITVISHHFRTPITALQGYIELLKLEKLLPHEVKDIVGGIDTNTRLLQKIIENSLTITEIQTNPQEVTKNQYDLKEIIDEIAAKKSKEYELKINVSSVSCIAYINRQYFSEAIQELMDNACKFGKEHIDVSLACDIKNIHITIKDNGYGIPQEFQKQLFTAYARPLKELLQFDQKGMGLGLFKAKLIIEKHNGTITLDTKKNEGTTVNVLLPHVLNSLTRKENHSIVN